MTKKNKNQNPREKLFTVYRDKITGSVYPDDFGNDRYKRIDLAREIIAALGARLDGDLMQQVIAREVHTQIARVIEGTQQKVVGASAADLQMIERTDRS